jgi:LEA14-like dessication related protein
MKNKILLLAAAAGAAYYFLIGKKRALESLEIKPIDVAINTAKSKQFFYSQLFYNLKLKITNSESLAAKIQNIDIDIYINNKKASEINSNTPIVIPARTEGKIVSIEGVVMAANLITLILEFIADRQPINIKAIGNVTTDLGTIEINYSKNVTL